MVKTEEMLLQNVYDNHSKKSTYPDVLCNLFLFFLGLCVDRVNGMRICWSVWLVSHHSSVYFFCFIKETRCRETTISCIFTNENGVDMSIIHHDYHPTTITTILRIVLRLLLLIIHLLTNSVMLCQ
jgi:hypothetical protein